MSDLVEIVHHRDHQLVKGPKGSRGCKHVMPDGRRCGKAKTDPLHHGPPPSLNVAGSGSNHFAYQVAKKRWQDMLIEKLAATDLPRPCASILVEGRCCFPDRRRRDQGNFRYFIEKALGDALVAGGWLVDDSWDQYEFGGLAKAYTPGEASITLVLMPVVAVMEVAA